MRRIFRWMLVLILGGAVGRAAAEQQPEPRLLEAQATFNEATTLRASGEFARARARVERAFALRKAVLGSNHPDVASCLDVMGDLYRQQGDTARAKPLLERAFAIREAALGKNHPAVADALNNLAILYKDQGLYGQAEPLCRRALSIREAILGKSHPDVADSLNNLAIIYHDQGSYDRAEPLYQRALAIREATLGKSHPAVADALNNLANLYSDQGLYGQTEPLYQRVLAIREAALGKNHPAVAEALNNFAAIYYDQGLYGQAEPLYRRALAICEAVLGKSHPAVARMLGNLARLLSRQHLADALPLFGRAFSISEQRLRREALDFSESRLSNFLQNVGASADVLYFLLRTHPEDAQVRRLAFGVVLLLKGRSGEEMASISRTVYQSLGAEDRATFEQLQGLHAQLASLSLAGPGALSPEQYQRRLTELTDAGDSLEATLARHSARLRAFTALPPPREVVDRVAASLPKDSALVEFIAYRDRSLVPQTGTSRVTIASELRYLALVLFPDASTRAVDLGPAPPIDLAASRLRDALANRDVSFQAVAQELYQRAFEPLRPLLGTTHRLLLSPDGQLALIPFDALHDGQNFLLDSFDFTYLTSGSELLPRYPDSAPTDSVVVLADPDFTATPASAPAPSDPDSKPTSLSEALERFFSSLSSDLTRSVWGPLPGTRKEAQSIQRLLPQAQLFLGPAATKERILHLPAPGILHLATHGFFLEDDPSSSQAAHLRTAFASPSMPPLSQQEPMLNSGLVFAGARAVGSSASATPPKAALVTALELAGLNLWGTQLVVLSACDSGRGDVHLGQGIYGLRRALVVAGAETVVMSLWNVQDDSTSLLMDLYYRHLLAGQGRASALREAMRSFRLSHPHPHYWAPFIALGSDAPLRGITPSSSPTSGK